MSMTQIDALYRRILKDRSLAERLVLDRGEDAFAVSFAELGKSQGYCFTREEFSRWTRVMSGP